METMGSALNSIVAEWETFLSRTIVRLRGGVGECWIRLDLFRLGHDLVGFVGLGIIYSFFPIRSLVGIGVKYEQVFFFSP